VRIAIPPAGPGVFDEVRQDLVDVELADQVEGGRCVSRVEPGEEDDAVARSSLAEGEGAGGAAAVVAVGRHWASEVGIEVDGDPRQRFGRVLGDLGQVLQPEHRRPPLHPFRDRDHREAVVPEEGRTRRVAGVDADVGEEDRHP